MKRLLIVATTLSFCFFPIVGADAAGKKKNSRSDYSTEQQAKFYQEALKYCRKKYGSDLHHVEMNYTKRVYSCYHY